MYVHVHIHIVHGDFTKVFVYYSNVASTFHCSSNDSTLCVAQSTQPCIVGVVAVFQIEINYHVWKIFYLFLRKHSIQCPVYTQWAVYIVSFLSESLHFPLHNLYTCTHAPVPSADNIHVHVLHVLPKSGVCIYV